MAKEQEVSRKGYRVSLVILDRYTHWLGAFASETKNAEDTKQGFLRFMGPKDEPKHVYTDGSKEFTKALQDLKWMHDTSTPHRPSTNGVAERAVRRVKEGTACALEQSGWSPEWWPEAQNTYCFLHNVSDKQKDGYTAYESRYLKKFKGPLIPFGAAISYKPITDKDNDRVHKYRSKMLQGIFLGYYQQAGGGWSGDLLFADSEQIDEAESVSDIWVKRLKAQEVIPVKKNDNFVFPLAQGTIRQPGSHFGSKFARAREESREQAPTTSHPEVTIRPTDLIYRSEEEPEETEVPRTREKSMDYWSMTSDRIVRHHRTPRTELFVPTQHDCPIPLQYLDVMRTTETDLNNEKEAKIEDIWAGGNPQSTLVELSEEWTGKTFFDLLRPKPRVGYKWVEGRLTKIQASTRPDNICPETVSYTHLTLPTILLV